MLRDLTIRNILLIERLELEFQGGLNVLTGETGAGKSILLDCLGFVLGWRGPSDIVRQGASEGEVCAAYEIDDAHPAARIIEEAGIPFEGELILRRVSSGGRKKAFINDRRVTPDVLRSVGEHLVEIHGQHDDKGLLNAKSHITFLDSFASLDSDLERLGALWNACREADAELAKARDALENAARDAEFLKHALAEMDALDPQVGDDAALDRERRLLKAGEAIREDVQKAASAVGDDGAQSALMNAIRWLTDADAKADGRFRVAIDALERGLNEIADTERDLSAALHSLGSDPTRVEMVEERLFAIRAMARKHNVQPDELPDLTEEFRVRLEAVDGGSGMIAALERAAQDCRAAYDTAAERVSAKRAKAAKALDAAMQKELAPLKMERAVFQTVISEMAAGPRGIDAVNFRVATNPGAPAGPLAKIASGGELSRFLLALKIALQGREARTMIFDEIDRGVGGATADAVGRRLAMLSTSGQIIVVTHSPQVAALGGHHWRVEKSVAAGVTRTDVVPLAQAERVDELARMLAGENISDEAKSAAKVLLAG
jgi:DNA repair protein RecN (Recombination protein N)